MGMYTKFYGQILVKPEYRAMVVKICDRDSEINSWWDLASKVPVDHWLYRYASKVRSNHIPFGSNGLDDWQGPRIDDEGVFHIDCELKDYDNTIAAFMRLIVPNIAIKAEMISQSEEEDELTELNYYSPEIAMAPELGNKEEVELGFAPCLGGLGN